MTMKAILLATAVALIGLTIVADAQAATLAQRKEKRILDCTLEAKSINDCNIMGYAYRLIVHSLPGILVALGLLLTCPWYCCGKYCCNCCGGRLQTPSCCCVNVELPARYTLGDIIRPKVLLLVVFILTLGAMIWALTGVALLIGGLTHFAEAILGVPDILTREINLIGDSLVLSTWNTNTNTTDSERLFDTFGASLKVEGEKTRDTIKTLIDDSMGSWEKQVADFQNALWALFIVPCVFIYLGVILGGLNFRRIIMMAIVWWLFLFGFLMWLAHGVFSLASMLGSDVCAEVSGLANKRLNLVAVLAGCDDSMFSAFKTVFRELEITQAENTCNQISALCWVSTDTTTTNLANGKVFQCPDPLDCTGMTFAALVDMMDTQFYIHPTIETSIDPTGLMDQYRCKDSFASTGEQCTIKRCADNCIHPTAGYRWDIGQSSKTIYVAFLGAKTISNSLDTLGSRYATCDSVMSIVIAPFDAPCQEIASGLIYDRQASGLLGLAIIGSIFVFAWGAKRFISFDEVDKPQGDHWQAVPVQAIED